MFLTKNEILTIFGSLNECGIQLGKTRQAIYQAIGDGECSSHLTDSVLGFLVRNGRSHEIPERFAGRSQDGG